MRQAASPGVQAVRSGFVAPSQSLDSLAALDGDRTTELFSAQGVGTALVYTLNSPAALRGLSWVSGAGAVANDPARFEIYGSNGDGDASTGDWELIAESGTGIGEARSTASSVALESETLYRHYKIVFTELRNEAAATGVAVAEVRLLTGAKQTVKVALDGKEAQTARIESVLPSSSAVAGSTSAEALFDGRVDTLYRNTDGAGAGVLVSLDAAELVSALRLRANDQLGVNADETPTQVVLLGSNEARAWDSNGWESLATLPVELDASVPFAETVLELPSLGLYSHYKVVFETVRGGEAAAVSLSGLTFLGGQAQPIATQGAPGAAGQLDRVVSSSASVPADASTFNLFDGLPTTVYRNTDGAGSGVVLHTVEPMTLGSLQLQAGANGAESPARSC